MAAKRLELLRELVPAAARVAVLVNPADAAKTETTLRDVEPAARAMGLQIQVLNASSSARADLTARSRKLHGAAPSDASFVGPVSFFVSRRAQLVQLAARHAMPATYAWARHTPKLAG